MNPLEIVKDAIDRLRVEERDVEKEAREKIRKHQEEVAQEKAKKEPVDHALEARAKEARVPEGIGDAGFTPKVSGDNPVGDTGFTPNVGEGNPVGDAGFTPKSGTGGTGNDLPADFVDALKREAGIGQTDDDVSGQSGTRGDWADAVARAVQDPLGTSGDSDAGGSDAGTAGLTPSESWQRTMEDRGTLDSMSPSEQHEWANDPSVMTSGDPTTNDPTAVDDFARDDFTPTEDEMWNQQQSADQDRASEAAEEGLDSF